MPSTSSAATLAALAPLTLPYTMLSGTVILFTVIGAGVTINSPGTTSVTVKFVSASL